MVYLVHSPDISDVGEQGALKFPEQVETVFEIGLQLHVTGLARYHERVVDGAEARSEGADLPASHAAGAAGVELLFERQRGGIAVGVAYAHVEPHRDRMPLVGAEAQHLAQLKLGPDVLIVGQAHQETVAGDLAHRHEAVEDREHVAGNVDREPREAV